MPTGGPKIDSGENCFPLKVANQLASYFYTSPVLSAASSPSNHLSADGPGSRLHCGQVHVCQEHHETSVTIHPT